MQKGTFLFLFNILVYFSVAQPVEVRADYNAVGDVDFVAYNNTKAPLFVHLILGDLENTYYRETLPIVKEVEPGFNALFTLERNLGGEGSIRFHHEIKYYRSNPVADVQLDFSYLIPFEPGKKVQSVLVEDINGFMGMKVPKSWTATGFKAKSGDKVFAARNGIITEISSASRNADVAVNYNGWKYAVTVLQNDGTLACYRNVAVPEKKWKVGDKIFAGQLLGLVSPGAKELIFLIYHEKLQSNGLTFIVPQFVLSENKTDLILSESEFTVIHPIEIRGIEMDKKEKRKFLK
ncbi:M23 family metallopeptidase [Maribellus maritimus]|uniref:M23 family metallopeptidase n=1 Tax=Maribellus maritimus TaxID=2870838 RepID=UPI001EEA0EAA|nr:M23 family metallopeptidase [Maribellus maritimus]MCG6189554.1 M23 family metallopeptidase [Maribellus maritimus]